MAVENKGNLITRRAFAGDDGERAHRMKVLRRIVNKAMSTTYQMTEEIGDFGSGSPSPLHQLCEMVRECLAMDKEEGSGVSTALELARYPQSFLAQLRGEVSLEGDVAQKLTLLLKVVSDANFQLQGRPLSELKLGELKEFAQQALTAGSLAHELQVIAEALISERGINYPGSPMQGDRIRSRDATEVSQ